MYVVSEALRLMQKSGQPKFAAVDAAVLKNYKGHIDNATKFIPNWVKVAVALALGMGTMIGWKKQAVSYGPSLSTTRLAALRSLSALRNQPRTSASSSGIKRSPLTQDSGDEGTWDVRPGLNLFRRPHHQIIRRKDSNKCP